MSITWDPNSVDMLLLCMTSENSLCIHFQYMWMHVIECTHIHVGCLRVCVACRKWTLWRETRFVTHVLVAMMSGCACMHVSLHALTQWGEFKQIEETQSEKLEKFLDELEDSEDDSEDSDYSDDGDDGEDDESDDPESGDLEKDFEDLEESDEDAADQWKKKKCRKRRLTITNWVSDEQCMEETHS